MAFRWSWLSIAVQLFVVPSVYSSPLQTAHLDLLRRATPSETSSNSEASASGKDTPSNFFLPSGSNSVRIGAFVGIGLVILCTLIVVLFYCCRRRKPKKHTTYNGKHDGPVFEYAPPSKYAHKKGKRDHDFPDGAPVLPTHFGGKQAVVFTPHEQEGGIVLLPTLLYGGENEKGMLDSAKMPKPPAPAKLTQSRKSKKSHKKASSSDSFSATQSFDDVSMDGSTLDSGRSTPQSMVSRSASNRSLLSRNGTTTLVRTPSGRFDMVRTSILLSKAESEVCSNCGLSLDGSVRSEASQSRRSSGSHSPYPKTEGSESECSDFWASEPPSRACTPAIPEIRIEEEMDTTFLAPRVAPPPPALTLQIPNSDVGSQNGVQPGHVWRTAEPPTQQESQLHPSPSMKRNREASPFNHSRVEVAYIGAATCLPSPPHYDPTPPPELLAVLSYSDPSPPYKSASG